MTLDEFWAIIEASQADNPDDQLDKYADELYNLSEEELLGFRTHYHQRLKESNTWELWGAAFLINFGCSDEGFEHFRDWLIAQGRTVFTEAVSQPESLTLIAQPEHSELEDFRFVMADVYEENFGKTIPGLPEELEFDTDPTGTPWDEKDLGKLYPRLYAWISQFESEA